MNKNSPLVKILAVSNVYCRLMNFEKAGDEAVGHSHFYDHGTLVSSGSVKVDILNEQDEVMSSKIFQAPNFIFVEKDKKHRITSLEDNTVAVCIHALRDVYDNLIDPDFLIDPTIFDENIDGDREDFETLNKTMLEKGNILKRFTS
jgi:quercetin dioxygenase-like cupin family protein